VLINIRVTRKTISGRAFENPILMTGFALNTNMISFQLEGE